MTAGLGLPAFYLPGDLPSQWQTLPRQFLLKGVLKEEGAVAGILAAKGYVVLTTMPTLSLDCTEGYSSSRERISSSGSGVSRRRWGDPIRWSKKRTSKDTLTYMHRSFETVLLFDPGHSTLCPFSPGPPGGDWEAARHLVRCWRQVQLALDCCYCYCYRAKWSGEVVEHFQ